MSDVLGLFDFDESIDFGATGSKPSAARAGDAGLSLQAVGAEIASLAGSIAAVTSLIDAATTRGMGMLRRDVLVALLPPEPAVYRAVIGSLAAVNADLTADIQHFHTRLELTTNATLATCASPDKGEGGGCIDIEVLADAWRQPCVSTLEILEEACARAERPQRWATQLPRLRSILTRAGAGEAPCVAADGSIEVPGIAERRRTPRYPVAWSALLPQGDRAVPITLFDVSRSGFGADGVAHLVPGEAITLVVGERELTGRVRWTADQRFAIELDAPLSSADPIILAARDQRSAP